MAGGDLAHAGGWDSVSCIVPLTTALRRLGTMGFASLRQQAYGNTDGEFLQQVGKQVAVAVDNVLHHQDLARDRDRLRLLLEVSESIASHRDLDELLRDLAQRAAHTSPFDYINVVLHDPFARSCDCVFW